MIRYSDPKAEATSRAWAGVASAFAGVGNVLAVQRQVNERQRQQEVTNSLGEMSLLATRVQQSSEDPLELFLAVNDINNFNESLSDETRGSTLAFGQMADMANAMLNLQKFQVKVNPDAAKGDMTTTHVSARELIGPINNGALRRGDGTYAVGQSGISSIKDFLNRVVAMSPEKQKGVRLGLIRYGDFETDTMIQHRLSGVDYNGLLSPAQAEMVKVEARKEREIAASVSLPEYHRMQLTDGRNIKRSQAKAEWLRFKREAGSPAEKSLEIAALRETYPMLQDAGPGTTKLIHKALAEPAGHLKALAFAKMMEPLDPLTDEQRSDKALLDNYQQKIEDRVRFIKDIPVMISKSGLSHISSDNIVSFFNSGGTLEEKSKKMQLMQSFAGTLMGAGKTDETPGGTIIDVREFINEASSAAGLPFDKFTAYMENLKTNKVASILQKQTITNNVSLFAAKTGIPVKEIQGHVEAFKKDWAENGGIELDGLGEGKAFSELDVYSLTMAALRDPEFANASKAERESTEFSTRLMLSATNKGQMVLARGFIKETPEIYEGIEQLGDKIINFVGVSTTTTDLQIIDNQPALDAKKVSLAQAASRAAGNMTSSALGGFSLPDTADRNEKKIVTESGSVTQVNTRRETSTPWAMRVYNTMGSLENGGGMRSVDAWVESYNKDDTRSTYVALKALQKGYEVRSDPEYFPKIQKKTTELYDEIAALQLSNPEGDDAIKKRDADIKTKRRQARGLYNEIKAAEETGFYDAEALADVAEFKKELEEKFKSDKAHQKARSASLSPKLEKYLTENFSKDGQKNQRDLFVNVSVLAKKVDDLYKNAGPAYVALFKEAHNFIGFAPLGSSWTSASSRTKEGKAFLPSGSPQAVQALIDAGYVDRVDYSEKIKWTKEGSAIFAKFRNTQALLDEAVDSLDPRLYEEALAHGGVLWTEEQMFHGIKRIRGGEWEEEPLYTDSLYRNLIKYNERSAFRKNKRFQEEIEQDNPIIAVKRQLAKAEKRRPGIEARNLEIAEYGIEFNKEQEAKKEVIKKQKGEIGATRNNLELLDF